MSVLNKPIEHLTNDPGTLLGNPLLIIFIVNISDTKPGLITTCPFKITKAKGTFSKLRDMNLGCRKGKHTPTNSTPYKP